MNVTHRLTRRTTRAHLALFGALLALLFGFGASAHAEATHPYLTSFGPAGVGTASSFRLLSGLAVDQATGDVYVLNTEPRRLYKFNAAGEPANFSSTETNVIVPGTGNSTLSRSGGESQIAVDSSTGPDAGDIYVATNAGVWIFASSGVLIGELHQEGMCGVAVSSSGELYVGIRPETVRRYAPVTNPVTAAQETGSMSGLAKVCNIAVDNEDDVYTATPEGGVYKYDALQFGSMSAVGVEVAPKGTTLAVDPVSDEVLVDTTGEIHQYDGTAEPPAYKGSLNAPGESTFSDSFGVAIDHASGKVYANSGRFVDVFGPSVEAASAKTEQADGISNSGATLRGSILPEGQQATGCFFEYGAESEGLTRTVPCAQNPPFTGAAPIAVSAQLTGLPTGTNFHYRLVAQSADASAFGEEAEFLTLGPALRNEGVNFDYSAHAELVAEVNPHGVETSSHIEYGTTTAYGSSTPTRELGAGGLFTGAGYDLQGLHPGTTYHFRVVATNEQGTATGADVVFTTHLTAASESVYEVGTTSAELTAKLEPYGEATSYQVEYGTSTAYGSSTPLLSGGAGTAPVSVVVPISGLQPDTVYHFRFVTVRGGLTEPGEDVTFVTHTLNPPVLPDGRGYEMVTPTDNEGAETYAPSGAYSSGRDALPAGQASGSAQNGEAVVYTGAPTAGGNGNQGAGKGNQFMATRNPDGGWTQRNLQPPGYNTPIYAGFSSDLSQGELSSKEMLGAGLPDGYSDLYVHDNLTGSLEPLITVTPPNRTAAQFKVESVGSSGDFEHHLFEANDALASSALDPGIEGRDPYDYFAGQLHTVNVLPDGKPAPDATLGGYELGSNKQFNLNRVVSADGSRIFWTDLASDSLYVREDATTTTLIAEKARYLLASADGSKVLYYKEGDLYEDDLNTGATRDLVHAGKVLGILGAGEDLQYVYLVAEGALSAGATEGQPNLYLLRDGTPVFIATLGEEIFEGGSVEPWQGSEAQRRMEVTPSGQYLVFMSHKRLTDYDNVVAEARGSEEAYEVYYYDANANTLSCPSCNSSGEAPAKSGSGLLPTGVDQHVISEDGQRVFFESEEPVLPQAKNDKLNVFEWEPDGAGACVHAGGCTYLLSSGSSPSSSFFVGASANGDDVFVMTRSPLLPIDKNEYFDIYDARVGAVEPPAPTQCTGTGCQGIAASPPIFATPSSATFAGVGNFEASKPASKPKPKKKVNPRKTGKCVAKSKKMAKRAKSKTVSCKTKKAAKRVRSSKRGRGTR